MVGALSGGCAGSSPHLQASQAYGPQSVGLTCTLGQSPDTPSPSQSPGVRGTGHGGPSRSMSPGCRGPSGLPGDVGAMHHCPAAPDTGGCARRAGLMPRGNENPRRRRGRWTEGAGHGQVRSRGFPPDAGSTRPGAGPAVLWVGTGHPHARPLAPSVTGCVCPRGQDSPRNPARPAHGCRRGPDSPMMTQAPTTQGTGVGQVMLCTSPYPDVTWRQPCLPRSYCGGTSPSRRVARSSGP